MPHFQLLQGRHEDWDGKQYVAGDVIESARDLEKTWVNKFRRVDPSARPQMVDGLPAPASPEELRVELAKKLGMLPTDGVLTSTRPE